MKDKDDKNLTTEKDQMHIWVELFKQLLNSLHHLKWQRFHQQTRTGNQLKYSFKI